jgi:transposase InsO family protein
MSHFTDRITPIHVCWQLYNSGVSPEEIPAKIGKHRATVYRWIKGINEQGFSCFLEDYQNAKKGRRNRSVTPYIKAKVFEVRKEYKNCCGQKIKYILKRDYNISLGVSTIYKILGEKYQLRSKWKKYCKRGPVLTPTKPRCSIQFDTVDCGELYAFTSIDIFTKEPVVVIKEAITSKAGKEALDAQLEWYGEVDQIQRDGGPEFKDKWEEEVRNRNIPLRTSRPYKKNDQAFIEKFNGTLRKECFGYVKYKKKDKERLQKMVNEYIDFYLTKRPHMSLNMQTPKEFAMSHLT